MEFKLQPGLKAEFTAEVKAEHTAAHLGSGGVPVLATPILIAFLERASREAVQPELPEGWTTVGTLVNIRHLAATPVGLKLTARSTLTEVDGRRLVFAVEAYDDKEKVGEGVHERFIIDTERFLGRVEAKRR
ncbi:thioesterase family protein [Gelria sp. Kuro-4]|uniref:thioesterase family protein n=1 Tax=Gelria sp. Kuro-4 TaxID=2796927 RepID=UPI001BEF629B|nr:thioesterase family protein [Gelria sp. Kuro-4]BCV23403.1 thioesterase [Gelria sp. Kuro-4]